MNNVLCDQKNFFNLIDKEIASQKLTHAFCIETNNYIYTREVVKELCKRIIGKNDSNINFLIDQDMYPDIVFVSPDGDYIKKSQLLNVRKDFSTTSIFCEKKIYIITDADKLNESSANTILKFLEEPTSGVYAILLCSSRFKVLDTIISRCQVLSLNSTNSDVSTQYDNDIKNLFNIISSGIKTYVRYSEILFILEDKTKCSLLLKGMELYIFDLYSSEDNNIKKKKYQFMIFVIEEMIDRLNYNLNFKLFVDDLIFRLGEAFE